MFNGMLPFIIRLRFENMHLDSIPELEEYEYNDNEYEQDREMFETTDIQNRKYKKKQKV